MKIRMDGITDELILKDMAVLSQTHFSGASLVAEGEDLLAEFCEERTLKSISIKGRMGLASQAITRELDAAAPEKTRKYAYLSCYAKLLEEYTGQAQSWGLLNGMRPTKLVHSLKKSGQQDHQVREFMESEYLPSPEKMDLLLEVANRQLEVIPDLYSLEKEVSIYIGIPFCPTRCAYCTFAAYAMEPFKKWVEPFVQTLIKEIEGVGRYLKKQNIQVTSIYFGGGTATSLGTEQLKAVMDAVHGHLAAFESVREITMEAGRPDTITPEKLELIKAYGIKRISINPQTYHQKTLDTIGRHHSVQDILDKYEMAKGLGIENINMDLIVGLPGEGPKELAYSLKQTAKLQPESLTIHMLAYKRKSKLTKERGLYTTATKEEINEMGRMTYEFAKSNDYVPYYLYRQKNISGNMENIGYSKAGQESIYNIVMMEEAQNVLGFGVGASSKYLIGTSVHNPRDIKTYLDTYENYIEKKIQVLTESLAAGAVAFSKNE
ncbi:MAG: coproporphyrinogen dehydrogenase HemZ [Turicibacter sp.]|nr:coproporphyrinogen dehydrogenase HemZ [Turicibacter sp.]